MSDSRFAFPGGEIPGAVPEMDPGGVKCCGQRKVVVCLFAGVEMARKLCLVPNWWTPEDIPGRRCGDRSHMHVSFREKKELLEANLAEWLLFPRVLRFKRQLSLRGLSCRVGGELACAHYERQLWANLMIREIFQRPDRLREYLMAEEVPTLSESEGNTNLEA